MKVEKDEEWTRLEKRIAELKTEIREAKAEYEAYAKQHILRQLGIVLGQTIVGLNGQLYIACDVRVDEYDPWVYGRLYRKDRTPYGPVVCLHGPGRWQFVAS